MKRFIILISLIPHLLYAQYQSKEFMLLDERNAAYQVMRITTSIDSIVSLNINQPISSLFISGTTILENANDSYARVTLKDRNDLEYLVYENYLLLSNETFSRFSKVGIESVFLNDIVPASIKIEVCGASIQIDSIYFSGARNQKQGFYERAKSIRYEQTQKIAVILNDNLMEKHMTWLAGPTPIASKSFEEKKMMFGSKVPCLYGFDYYKGGLYIQGPLQAIPRNTAQQPARNNQFVKDFDWRNRHGKNWITSVKKQIGNTCWDFATVATIESNFNIYFNQVFEDTITNNLSEQELVSCLDNDNQTIHQRLYESGYSNCALDYIKRRGIVREECFPWLGEVPCGKCDSPVEQVSFSSFRDLYGRTFIYTSSDEIVDTLKKAIIKSPVVVDRYSSIGGHSVSCIGFHQIQMGDTLCQSFSPPYTFVVDSTSSNYVGLTSWIIKDSKGSGWGEYGFARMIFEGARYRIYELSGPYTSLIYSDVDRCVTDEDMDGYYTWGSGSKPANLPIWVPNQQDGDDTNPNIGAIDGYGNCDTLIVNPAITWYINSNVSYNTTDNFTYPNIIVLQGGTLTINSSTMMMMKRNATIRVQNGGKLIIDGGQIQEADIVIENGGMLIIDNGGLIRLKHDGQYLTQVGAKVSINNGKIE